MHAMSRFLHREKSVLFKRDKPWYHPLGYPRAFLISFFLLAPILFSCTYIRLLNHRKMWSKNRSICFEEITWDSFAFVATVIALGTIRYSMWSYEGWERERQGKIMKNQEERKRMPVRITSWCYGRYDDRYRFPRPAIPPSSFTSLIFFALISFSLYLYYIFTYYSFTYYFIFSYSDITHFKILFFLFKILR